MIEHCAGDGVDANPDDTADQNVSGQAGCTATAEFLDAFRSAKARIRAMDYRFVEETDQTRQALLEIYCAVVLGTPYNDFNTH